MRILLSENIPGNPNKPEHEPRRKIAWVSFGVQEFNLMESVRFAIHENMINVRAGDVSYIRKAYAALYEYWIGFLRPLFLEAELKKYIKDGHPDIDAGFETVKNMLRDTRGRPEPQQLSLFSRIAEGLDEIEQELMRLKQRKNLGILMTSEDKAVGAAKALKPEQRKIN